MVIEILRALGERVQTAGHVRSVFGEPITAHGRTLVPVARIRFGLGAGGKGRTEANSPDRQGGGAGVMARPAGVFEITEAGTRFIPATDPVRMGVLFSVGMLLGHLLARRSLRR